MSNEISPLLVLLRFMKDISNDVSLSSINYNVAMS